MISRLVRTYKKSMDFNHLIRLITIVAALMSASYTNASPKTDAAPYLLGPGDTIIVNVQRHPEFSGELLIPNDGQINIAGAGTIFAAGKTLNELGQDIVEKLKTRLREPEVTVSLKSPREQKIYVSGAVKTPGALDIKPNWRLMEAITAAGGVLQEADQTRSLITIIRGTTGERISFKLSDLLIGTPAANPSLYAGDVIIVDPGEVISVYVTGKVKSPGLYTIGKDSADVLKAIALAGGALQDALLSAVKIVHPTGSTQSVNITNRTSDTQSFQHTTLQSGDIIIVPENTARVAVLGYVGEPGFFLIPEDRRFLLSDVLAMAKGFENKRAGLKSVAVIRTEDGKQTKMVFDISRFLKNGDTTQNPELKAGDVVYVPQTNRVDWESVLRSVASIGIFLSPFTK